MNRRQTRSIDKPVAVAVEGNDYFYAILAVIRDDPKFETVQLWNFCEPGYDDPKNWLALLKTLRGFSSDVKAIGFIRDAEESAAARNAQLQSAFGDNGFDVPHGPNEIMSGFPAVGFLIMPHGKTSGCLENALLDAVHVDCPFACAKEFVKCVDRPERNDNWRAKVAVHSLIASGETPQMTLGESVRGGRLWDFSRPSLCVMIDFISTLVDQASAA